MGVNPTGAGFESELAGLPRKRPSSTCIRSC
jgi:hypothetical protein